MTDKIGYYSDIEGYKMRQLCDKELIQKRKYILSKIMNMIQDKQYKIINSDVEWFSDFLLEQHIIFNDCENNTHEIGLVFVNFELGNIYFPYDKVEYYINDELVLVFEWENDKYKLKNKPDEYIKLIYIHPSTSDDAFCELIGDNILKNII